jgi:hypothetical protein
MSSRIVQGALCGLLLCILSGAVHAQPADDWTPPSGDCGGSASDVNENGISDGCDIAYGFSLDQNGNGIPDETECPLSALVCTASPTTDARIWQVNLDWETPLLDFWNYESFEIECAGLDVPSVSLTSLPNSFTVDVSLAGAPCGGEFSLAITVTGHCSNSWSLVTSASEIPQEMTFDAEGDGLCSTEIIPQLDYQFSLKIPGTAHPSQVQVPPNLPHAPFLIDARIFEGSGGDCDPVDSSHGFSMGVETPSGLDVLEGVAHPELVGALGGHPEFFDLDILAAGWTVGVLYDLFAPFGGNPPLSADFAETDGLGVVRVLYSTSSCPPTGPTVYTLSFTEELGPANMYGLENPPVRNLVVYQGEAFPAEKSELVFTITTGTEYAFQRGDCNGISGLTLADAVLVLAYLFSNGGDPACLDACDANDSGSLEMGDAIFLLSHLFVPGSGSPPAPHPAEGSDPTEDLLTCESYAAVPCP